MNYLRYLQRAHYAEILGKKKGAIERLLGCLMLQEGDLVVSAKCADQVKQAGEQV